MVRGGGRDGLVPNISLGLGEGGGGGNTGSRGVFVGIEFVMMWIISKRRRAYRLCEEVYYQFEGDCRLSTSSADNFSLNCGL